MREFTKLISTVALVAVMVGLCSFSFAATKPIFVITNDDNTSANTATVYSFNSTNGTLKQVKVLKTGGTGLGGGFFAMKSQAVQHNDKCIFVMDSGSNDIAAFQGPAGLYKKAGKFSNAKINTSANGLGGSIALSPNGKFLYEGATGSLNVGAWKVNANCSLKFIAAYAPKAGQDLYNTIRVTPDGKTVVAPAIDFQAAEAFSINQTTGTLKDLGFVAWTGNSTCSSGGCFPFGLDFSPDSKVVVFGNPSTALNETGLTASVGAKGLSKPALWDLINKAGVQNLTTVNFSPTCTATSPSCVLFFGGSGFTTPEQPGIVTTTYTKTPLKLKVTQSIAIGSGSAGQFINSVALAGPKGSWMIIAQTPNNILVYPVSATGKLGKLKSKKVDAQSTNLISLSVF
jgi:hypothetical protein